MKPAIDKVRLALFIDDDDLEQFDKIVDRLEGYEVAYNTLLKENERLKEDNERLLNLKGTLEEANQGMAAKLDELQEGS